MQDAWGPTADADVDHTVLGMLLVIRLCLTALKIEGLCPRADVARAAPVASIDHAVFSTLLTVRRHLACRP